jgi:hypothetical protein
MTARLVRTCAVCGSGPTELHHPTCRPGPELPYFDPGLRIVLCSGGSVHNHHDRVGEALRDLGLAFLPSGANPLSYRVVTLAMHAGYFADADRGLILADGAASRSLQRLLLEVDEALSNTEEAAA